MKFRPSVYVLAGLIVLAAIPPSAAMPPAGPAVTRATAAVLLPAAARKRPRHVPVPYEAFVPAAPRPPAHAPECPGLYSWNPNNPDRGYCDPGFAYHGNKNGCVFDEGYGRWSVCR